MRELLSPILVDLGNGHVGFHCPGCDELHVVTVSGAGAWGYNGNPDAPTFTPSVLVRGGHYAPGWCGPSCYCTPRDDGEEWGFKCKQCHSHVADGKIQFLGDCSHSLAGQTVPLAPIRMENV